MVPHIAVVGAGISGLSTAVLVQDKIPGIRITVISDKFSPDTTGDVSAGLWFPYSLKDTPPQNIVRWSSKTYDLMLKLWQSSEASDVGVSLVPKFGLTQQPEGKHQDPEWSKIPVAYQYINKSQAQKVAACNKYTGGQHFITFTLEPSRYLPYLTRKFLQNGGEIKNKKVKTLQELCGDYDVVINCTGVHAHHVAEDNLINPIRGQVLRVKAPWVFTSLGEEKVDGNYIIPNIDCVVLGGTHQQGDWNTNPDPKDTKFITEGCQQIIPGLRDAEILSDRAGLRPGRTSVRLERDHIKDKYGNTLEVIHNYGHGGAGVTLSWGCAHDVLRILQDILNNQPFTRKFNSKL